MIQNRTAYLDSLDISNLGVCSKNLICLNLIKDSRPLSWTLAPTTASLQPCSQGSKPSRVFMSSLCLLSAFTGHHLVYRCGCSMGG